MAVRFDEPLMLLLLLALPFLMWLKRRRIRAIPFPALQSIKGRRGFCSRLMPFLENLWILVLALMIVALSGPQIPSGSGRGHERGLEMVLAIDTSASMKSLQRGRSKLDRVKEMAARFVRSREVDRIGLVAFAGDALMVAPLTDDYALIEDFIEDLTFGMLSSGTAIGDAVAAATNILKEGEGGERIIILLSDGVNNSGDIEPLDAASIAKTFGIRVYTIEEGRTVEHMMARMQGDYGADTDLLREVAKLTGGRHFKIPSPEELLIVYEAIDRLEKQRLERESYAYTDVYHWPATAALGLILAECVLTGTRFRRLV